MSRWSMCGLPCRGRVRRGQHGPKTAAFGVMEQQVNDYRAEKDVGGERDFYREACFQFSNFFGELAGKPAPGDPIIVFLFNPRGPDFWPEENEGKRRRAYTGPPQMSHRTKMN